MPPGDADYLSRAEATRRLGVKPATLYTYVSRGWIRRIDDPSGRRSLYHAEDIDKVRARGAARTPSGVLASGALRYGEPIVPTSVTEITSEGPRYRSRLAVELVQRGTSFEATAELLWTGVLREAPRAWHWPALPAPFLVAMRGALARDPHADIHDLLAVAALTLGMAKGRPSARAGDAAVHAGDAMQLIAALTGCFGIRAPGHAYRAPEPGVPIAVALAQSLGLRETAGTIRLLDAALTLSADHELNPATFVARIAASSEVDLHSAVAAAICTDSGARIARACDRLEGLLRTPGRGAGGVAGMNDLETLGTQAGFSHPLYPRGDPRGAALLALVRAEAPRTKALVRIDALLASPGRHGMPPRIEMSLAVLSVALHMPARTVAGLYTLGRVAGWVAHMTEQRLAGFLIRPRAKYVGPTP